MKKIAIAVAVACLPLVEGASAQMNDAPEAIRVPGGHVMTMRALGKGDLTYECRARAADAAAFEWAFVGPTARLIDVSTNKEVGRYYAGPTWESADGSKITGKQAATAPSAAGNIPMQLVIAEPGSMTSGAMGGITYIQRVNTRGGVAPADACDAHSLGTKKQVAYEAEYLFYRKS